ncbi:PspC domain-containing protein [Candidatus Woesearchaeota archaeon]|nr:PspC domain-containing protein [Candidatus Woesearchaeota archaeon]
MHLINAMAEEWFLAVPALVLFVIAFIIALFVLWLWALVDCIASKLRPEEKLLWIIVIIFFNVLGAVLYLILAKRVHNNMAESKQFKGKKLYRSRKNRMIAGVCGGLGEYADIDPTLVRLLWVIATIFTGGAGILAYIIAWIIIPEK